MFLTNRQNHHTHYQGTAFRLKFPIFTNIAIFIKPWRNNQLLQYNQTISFYKQTIKKLTIIKKKQFSRTNVFIQNRFISFDK